LPNDRKATRGVLDGWGMVSVHGGSPLLLKSLPRLTIRVYLHLGQEVVSSRFTMIVY
jgi:hypothetical protein